MRVASKSINVPFVRALAAGAVAVSLFTPGAVAEAAGPQYRGVYECAGPSIDRYQQWLASGEGTTVPATGSLLVREGRGYAAKVTFLKDEWHVAVVWLGNQFEAQADLSESSGFWMTYSATDDLYLQLRPASHWSGGDKWLTKVPATGGKRVTKFFSFAADNWTWLPELGQPSYSFASALAAARGFVFVGKTANKLDFRGLRIDGYQPPCR
ncbi:hypothetical protein JOD54_004297 [Actinokineospora baliensis]|uniref:hypothetical protein n=1 Tax=Actinokineospora baliensis TaxID=547056 RepID=UPI001EF78E92|nr:hypothetical protein [Actinokineospora baliensis]MBM7774093.1 hypothetical protein [Actinokineospora baliensis]